MSVLVDDMVARAGEFMPLLTDARDCYLLALLWRCVSSWLGTLGDERASSPAGAHRVLRRDIRRRAPKTYDGTP